MTTVEERGTFVGEFMDPKYWYYSHPARAALAIVLRFSHSTVLVFFYGDKWVTLMFKFGACT